MKKDKIIFGWQEPPNRDHIAKYPFALNKAAAVPDSWCHNLFPLFSPTDPWGQRFYDQLNTPQCVGFACARVMSWWNKERYYATDLYIGSRLYDGLAIDILGTTNFGAMMYLYKEGATAFHRTNRGVWKKDPRPDTANGILSWQWATSVDDIIAYGNPVVCGTKWFSGMMETEDIAGRQWICRTNPLGRLEGGHDYTIFAMDLEEKAAGIVNNWGIWYSRGDLAWMPFDLLGELIKDGEVPLIIDRPGGAN